MKDHNSLVDFVASSISTQFDIIDENDEPPYMDALWMYLTDTFPTTNHNNINDDDDTSKESQRKRCRSILWFDNKVDWGYHFESFTALEWTCLLRRGLSIHHFDHLLQHRAKSIRIGSLHITQRVMKNRQFRCNYESSWFSSHCDTVEVGSLRCRMEDTNDINLHLPCLLAMHEQSQSHVSFQVHVYNPIAVGDALNKIHALSTYPLVDSLHIWKPIPMPMPSQASSASSTSSSSSIEVWQPLTINTQRLFVHIPLDAIQSMNLCLATIFVKTTNLQHLTIHLKQCNMEALSACLPHCNQLQSLHIWCNDDDCVRWRTAWEELVNATVQCSSLRHIKVQGDPPIIGLVAAYVSVPLSKLIQCPHIQTIEIYHGCWLPIPTIHGRSTSWWRDYFRFASAILEPIVRENHHLQRFALGMFDPASLSRGFGFGFDNDNGYNNDNDQDSTSISRRRHALPCMLMERTWHRTEAIIKRIGGLETLEEKMKAFRLLPVVFTRKRNISVTYGVLQAHTDTLVQLWRCR